jgi:hypothetical protein
VKETDWKRLKDVIITPSPENMRRETGLESPAPVMMNTRGDAMSTTVTVTLQDDVYRQAVQFAQMANVKVAEVLKDAIELSLSPVSPEPLSDKEVLRLTELQMPPAEDRRLSRLLDRQQKGKLTAGERAELFALMQAYQSGLLRKAQALSEAVRRGLIEPLTP